MTGVNQAAVNQGLLFCLPSVMACCDCDVSGLDIIDRHGYLIIEWLMARKSPMGRVLAFLRLAAGCARISAAAHERKADQHKSRPPSIIARHRAQEAWASALKGRRMGNPKTRRVTVRVRRGARARRVSTRNLDAVRSESGHSLRQPHGHASLPRQNPPTFDVQAKTLTALPHRPSRASAEPRARQSVRARCVGSSGVAGIGLLLESRNNPPPSSAYIPAPTLAIDHDSRSVHPSARRLS
jgi:hypothetical protein